MANKDLVVTFLNGDILKVHRESSTQVEQVRAALEQLIEVQDLMEIKLILGTTVLRDPLPDNIDGTIQGVISPSAAKALKAVRYYADTVNCRPDATYIPKQSPPPSDDDSDSCPSLVSESSTGPPRRQWFNTTSMLQTIRFSLDLVQCTKKVTFAKE